MLFEYEAVNAAARELMEGRTVSSIHLTDRQLRGARRLLWRREMRQDQGGYHGSPLGSGLANWRWVRNTPPPISQDLSSIDKSMEDVESDASFRSSENGTISPRKRNPLFGIFGGEDPDTHKPSNSLKAPLIDTKEKVTKKGLFASAKSIFSKSSSNPLIFDSISRFAVCLFFINCSHLCDV